VLLINTSIGALSLPQNPHHALVKPLLQVWGDASDHSSLLLPNSRQQPNRQSTVCLMLVARVALRTTLYYL
jgi:hypothetical protein